MLCFNHKKARRDGEKHAESNVGEEKLNVFYPYPNLNLLRIKYSFLTCNA